MRIQASLLPLVLGLLPSLVKAAAVEVPVYSTLEEPFVISVQDDFRIVLKWSEKYNDYEPQLSHAKTDLPEFKLTAGNLTTVGGPVKEGYTAVTPTIGQKPPPSLNPVWFEKNPPRAYVPPFVAVTHRSGILRLWSINGPLVVRELKEGEQVRQKSPENPEDAIILKLDIHHTYHKFGFIDEKTSDEDCDKHQKSFRYNREIK